MATEPPITPVASVSGLSEGGVTPAAARHRDRCVLWLRTGIGWLEQLQPLALLLARWHVGLVFFRSGLTKVQDWETTLLLFENEYAVPLLPPAVAAVMGTAGELLLPLLLFVGLAGRLGAAGLSVVNIVAVLSLPEMPEAALQLHIFWGCLLLAVLLWGPGRWSVDRYVSSQLSS